MPLLQIKNLDVLYGDIQVVYDASLQVKQGEILSIIGANGAGKSTMLKCISGLIAPTSGTIDFDGKRIDFIPSYKRVEMGIIQVPEGRRIFPFLTTLENLKLGTISLRARKSIDETLTMVYSLFPILSQRKGQIGSTLSGGEQQMLAIARGLMAKPRILMLDEPSLGLAPLVVRGLFEVIKKINKDGITILLVEQNVQQSLKVCDRGYVLENGRIILDGLGDDLIKNGHIKKAYLGM